jgi:hypothetical protein
MVGWQVARGVHHGPFGSMIVGGDGEQHAIDAGVLPRVGELPDDEALKPATDAVRPVLSVLGRGRSRPGQVRS